MPVSVTIKIDKKRLRRIQMMLRDVPKKMPQVMSTAINKTLALAKTQAAKQVKDTLNIKAKAVKRKIITEKATRQKWSGQLRFSDRRIPLINFAARQNKKGVTYQEGTDGRKLILSAFIQKMPKYGHKGVFERKGESRLPIQELFGSSLAEIVEKTMLVKHIEISAHKNLERNIDSQISYVLAKRKKAS